MPVQLHRVSGFPPQTKPREEQTILNLRNSVYSNMLIRCIVDKYVEYFQTIFPLFFHMVFHSRGSPELQVPGVNLIGYQKLILSKLYERHGSFRFSDLLQGCHLGAGNFPLFLLYFTSGSLRVHEQATSFSKICTLIPLCAIVCKIVYN